MEIVNSHCLGAENARVFLFCASNFVEVGAWPHVRVECLVPPGLGTGNARNFHCVCFLCTNHKLFQSKVSGNARAAGIFEDLEPH